MSCSTHRRSAGTISCRARGEAGHEGHSTCPAAMPSTRPCCAESCSCRSPCSTKPRRAQAESTAPKAQGGTTGDTSRMMSPRSKKGQEKQHIIVTGAVVSMQGSSQSSCLHLEANSCVLSSALCFMVCLLHPAHHDCNPRPAQSGKAYGIISNIFVNHQMRRARLSPQVWELLTGSVLVLVLAGLWELSLCSSQHSGQD